MAGLAYLFQHYPVASAIAVFGTWAVGAVGVIWVYWRRPHAARRRWEGSVDIEAWKAELLTEITDYEQKAAKHKENARNSEAAAAICVHCAASRHELLAKLASVVSPDLAPVEVPAPPSIALPADAPAQPVPAQPEHPADDGTAPAAVFNPNFGSFRPG